MLGVDDLNKEGEYIIGPIIGLGSIRPSDGNSCPPK